MPQLLSCSGIFENSLNGLGLQGLIFFASQRTEERGETQELRELRRLATAIIRTRPQRRPSEFKFQALGEAEKPYPMFFSK